MKITSSNRTPPRKCQIVISRSLPLVDCTYCLKTGHDKEECKRTQIVSGLEDNSPFKVILSLEVITKDNHERNA